MSGFTANSPAIPSEPDIIAGSFWPPTKLGSMRDALRLDGSVTPARLREAAVNAVIVVGDELAAWQAARMADGHLALADVPSPAIDSSTRHLLLYARAVRCATAVELQERFRSYDATAQGNQRADDLAPTIDELRRDLRHAVSDFLGRPRTLVDLI
ncbi:head completion/stabilization protein [Stenotrophomonas maltophilia]|uniref:head completion/stabilization protein n=1 Tax=Stenotrophomonas maltophilia TaxID=40324 RepID=UPI0015DF53D0|nr:head completion/stabilization protein [Stenotrophomonas maltophilia]